MIEKGKGKKSTNYDKKKTSDFDLPVTKEKNKKRKSSSVITTFVRNKPKYAEQQVSKTIILVFFKYKMKQRQSICRCIICGIPNHLEMHILLLHTQEGLIQELVRILPTGTSIL